MHNEVTKWRNCSLALHPDSAQRWEFEDTTNQKINAQILHFGATSHPKIHTSLPSSPRSQTNKRQSRCDKCHGSSLLTREKTPHPLISSPPFLLPRGQDSSLRSQSERQSAPCISANNSRKLRRSLHQRGCSTSANSTSASWPKSNWPKSKLAEVEFGRSRYWPKSKLIGRSRTDGVCSVSSLSCFFFSFVFLLFFTFFLFLLISLFILFLFCFCFRPEKPELNPKTRTLHPFPVNPPPPDNPPPDNPPPDNPPPDNPPPDRPKFRSFFPSFRHNFHSSFSLLGSFR